MNDDELPDEDTEACLGCDAGGVWLCTCGYCEDCIEGGLGEAVRAHDENCGPDEDTHPRRIER